MPKLCCCDPKRYRLCQERIATSRLSPPGTHPDNMICGYNPGEYEDWSGDRSRATVTGRQIRMEEMGR